MIKGQFTSKKNNKNIFTDFVIPIGILFFILYVLYSASGFSGSDSVSKALMDRYSDLNKTSLSK